MKVAIALVLLATFAPGAQKKVLVYTKNGKGLRPREYRDQC